MVSARPAARDLAVYALDSAGLSDKPRRAPRVPELHSRGWLDASGSTE
jgi:hypothetical protein